MTAHAAVAARAVGSGSRIRSIAGAGTLPLVAALAILFLWPALAIIADSFTDPPGAGLSNYRAIASDPVFLRFAGNTLRTAVIVSVLTGVLGYLYAYAIHQAEPWGRAILMNCALLPFWTSLLVRSFAWTVILRDTGIVNWLLLTAGIVSEPVSLLRTEFAVTLGMTQILLPFVILPVFASMSRFDPDLVRAARSLGAGPARAFWAVFFPCTRAGLLAGMLLVFVLSLGYYITPVLLGGPRDQPVAVLIDSQVTRQLDWGAAGAMSAIVVAAVLILLAIGWRAFGRTFQVEAGR